MRLLFLTDGPAWPPRDGVSTIASRWTMGLAARGHQVAWLPLATAPAEAREVLPKAGVEVLADAHATREPGVAAAVAARPRAWARYGADADAALDRAVAEERPDVVVLVGPAAAALLRRDPPVPAVHVPYDCVARVLASRPRPRSPVLAVHRALEAWRWRRVQRDVYPLAARTVFVTEADRASATRDWSAEDRARAVVVPLGCDVLPATPAPRPGRILMTGDLGSLESEVSARWFLTEVWPRVRDAAPEATFHLVGRRPSPALAASAEAAGAVVEADAASLDDAYAEAAVVVAPMRAGSGMKTRVVEALGRGRAVVGTPAAFNGIAGIPDDLVADAAPAFADVVARLLCDDAERRRAENTARVVAATYAWPKVLDRVERLLDEARRGST